MKKIMKRSRVLLALMMAVVMLVPSVIMAGERGNTCCDNALPKIVVGGIGISIKDFSGLYIARVSDDYYVLVNPDSRHMFEGFEIISLDASCEEENEIRPFGPICCNNMNVYTWNRVPIHAWAGGPQIGWREWQRCAGCRADWPTLTILW